MTLSIFVWRRWVKPINAATAPTNARWMRIRPRANSSVIPNDHRPLVIRGMLHKHRENCSQRETDRGTSSSRHHRRYQSDVVHHGSTSNLPRPPGTDKSWVIIAMVVYSLRVRKQVMGTAASNQADLVLVLRLHAFLSKMGMIKDFKIFHLGAEQSERMEATQI